MDNNTTPQEFISSLDPDRTAVARETAETARCVFECIYVLCKQCGVDFEQIRFYEEAIVRKLLEGKRRRTLRLAKD